MKSPLTLVRRPAPEETLSIGKVLRQNEVYANRLTAIAMCICSVVLGLGMLLTALGVFTEKPQIIYGTCITAMVWHLVPAIVCFAHRGEKPWIKYMLLTCLVIGQARINCGLGYHVVLCILLPVLFSTRYYSRRLTLVMACITTAVFALTTYLGAAIGFSPVDQNIPWRPDRYAADVMLYSFFPRWLVFAMAAGICAEIAHQGRNMVCQQANISQEYGRVETELSTASQIQMSSLPQVEKVLKSPGVVFDLATSIEPAKEVGGDFYDFFYIDPAHLALVIADVSGKGVPAALFMMISKILLDSCAADGSSPSKVLSTVNHMLCEKNINDMFVTAWLGILDLTTGELVTANAGHENPIVCRRNGTVEVIRTRHGMVLGGMDGVRYRDETIQLDPGDTLFVYTDGIPEAHNAEDEMYGMERLVKVLTGRQAMTPQDVLDAVTCDVSSFVGDVPQFDDSTMMALRMNSLQVRKGLLVRPDTASVAKVQEYVANRMEQADVPDWQAARMNICLDELYSNIVHYSGASWAEVVCTIGDGRLTVLLRDNGVPFDPLAMEAPDITLPAEERRMGGLGVFMTRKMMDELTYRYADGFNEVTMVLMLDHLE